ncbi:hypothetical protein BKA62DRAFT_729211 [Auriculariales sp. MPI-PUGE-AT-0066]|nr:hypothetical protein BKA62DRAFT_729211 [Auriculariales sp. MPI-PUGE-AT-0066]
MVSLFRYHMAANHIVHLEVYGCRDQTMDASAVAVRACPHIRHLGLYSRAGMVYLDALMHRTLGILQLPLLSLAVSSRGLNGQILADLLSQPHPALVQLRVLAVKDTTHAALRRACENRRILLRRLNGLAHLTKGPSRFDALFGRGKRWD